MKENQHQIGVMAIMLQNRKHLLNKRILLTFSKEELKASNSYYICIVTYIGQLYKFSNRIAVINLKSVNANLMHL